MLFAPHCVLISFHHDTNWLWKSGLGFSPRLRLTSGDTWAWCQGFLSMNLHLVSWRASSVISDAPALPTRSPAGAAEEYWSMHNFCRICQSLEDVSDMLRNLKWRSMPVQRELIFKTFIEHEGSVGVWLTWRHLHLGIWIWTWTPSLMLMLLTHCRWGAEAQRNEDRKCTEILRAGISENTAICISKHIRKLQKILDWEVL